MPTLLFPPVEEFQVMTEPSSLTAAKAVGGEELSDAGGGWLLTLLLSPPLEEFPGDDGAVVFECREGG